MKCTKCGAKLEQGTQACPACGAGSPTSSPEGTKPCPFCAEQIAVSAKKCRFCNEWLDKSAAPAPAPDIDPALGYVLPVNVSPLALIAGYLGLFSILIIVAPVGLLVSILAIHDLKKHPEKSGWGRAIFGLGSSILFTGILIFALLAAAFGK
ncbi:zinc ribbon domain-containing protein [bacterium]|nr:zinc ribbon domain-containing protein [bacterium]